jgi:hypothetical protein
MRTMTFAIGWLFIGAPLCFGQAFSPVGKLSPEDRVRFVYREIQQDKFGGVSDPAEVDIAPSALSKAWFTPKFIGALKQFDHDCIETGKSDGFGSVWFPGQDSSIKNVQVVTIDGGISNSATKVQATFLNFNKKSVYVYSFIKTAAGFRIDDIIDDDSSTFDQLKALAKKCRESSSVQ